MRNDAHPISIDSIVSTSSARAGGREGAPGVSVRSSRPKGEMESWDDCLMGEELPDWEEDSEAEPREDELLGLREQLRGQRAKSSLPLWVCLLSVMAVIVCAYWLTKLSHCDLLLASSMYLP